MIVLSFECVICLLVWDPGGRRGDTERIFNRLRCLVASIEALSTAHWSMSSVLYRRIALAIEMASKLDAFVLIVFLLVCMGPWRSLGRYGANIQPIAVSSGLN